MNVKIFFLLLAFAVFSADSKRKYQKHTSQKRIIKGEKAYIKDHKYFVIISNSDNLLCGGALVTLNKVISAAHCVVGSKNPLYIYPGLSSFYEIDDKTTRYESYNQAVHEKYYGEDGLRRNLKFDLAVIYLSTDVKFNDKVFPINIAANAPPVGANITIVGNGLTDCSEIVNGSCKVVMPDHLMQTNMTISKVLDTQLVVKMTPNRPCKGDSGGPYTYNGELVAVESYSEQDNCRGEHNYECATSTPIMLQFLARHCIYPANNNQISQCR